MITTTPTAEERLVLLASWAAPTAAEQEQLSMLVESDLDWPQLFSLADTGATAPLVYQRLQAQKLTHAVPAAVLRRFEAVTDAVTEQNRRRLAAAKTLLGEFERAGIDCVVLKGMLFGLEIYQCPYYKRMNDLDILIKLEDAPAALELYRQLGMISSTALFGKEAKIKPDSTHHLPSFATPDGALVVGTHWGLITPRAPYRIDYEAIWQRTRPIDFYGVPALAMAHADNAHHLCIHLPYYKTGVRELADIWNLIRYAGSDLDTQVVVEEINKAGSHDLVYHALSLVQRLQPTGATATLLDATRPHISRWCRYDTARKTQDVHVLMRSRSTHTATIEKAYVTFNSTDKLGEKRTTFVELWKGLLVPPAAEAYTMSSIGQGSRWVSRMLARMAAPYRLKRVFQRDLGQWLFYAALVKTVVDISICAARTAVNPQYQPPSLEDFAQKHGVTAAQVQSILDSQQ